jgi:hypothetical protein
MVSFEAVLLTTMPAAVEIVRAGNLRHQTVSHGEQGVVLGRFRKEHLFFQHTDHETAEDVDQGNDDARNGIPPHKLGRAVHGAVEIRLPGDSGPSSPGLVFVDQAGIEVRIDAHLLARHGVQGETGRHFGNPRGAFGDDHEIDDDQDDKDNGAHHIVAARPQNSRKT